MESSEITPVAQKIDRILKRIEDGDIKIPAFQRGYVWKQDQVVALLDSIRSDYPIGSVLLWNSSERLDATRDIAGFPLPDREPSYPVNYVLDGQQRISSIYAVFSSRRDQDASTEEYNPDTAIFDLYFDFDKDAICTAEDIGEDYNKNRVVCLRNFLDTTAFLDEVARLDPRWREAAKRLYSKFLNYEVPVVTIRNRKKEEVGIIFERINNTGTKLGMMDLMVAWTWSGEFHLKTAIDGVSESLDEKDFAGVPTRIMLQAVSAVVQNTTKSKAILTLNPASVREHFRSAQAALEQAVDFLSTEFNCSNSDFLPHVQQLVPLTRFFHETSSPTDTQFDALRRWFWATSFSRRYGAQTDEKMDADIEAMLELSGGDTSALDSYSHSLDVQTLLGTKFGKGHPYVRAFLLLLSAQSPLDLVKGKKVDTGLALSAFNRKEYHHVFPQAFLKRREVAVDQINTMLNFCFLPSDSNKQISQKQPSDYFFNMIPAGRYQEILKSNLLPLNKDIYRGDDYDKFLQERATLLVQKVNELVTT